jgi:hypothetical protein
VVGIDAFGQGTLRWQGASPTGAETPYGRALLTPREVLVPTTAGIAIFDPAGGRSLGLAVLEAQPEATREILPEGIVPFGTLVPWPGRGLVALNEAWIALWTH